MNRNAAAEGKRRTVDRFRRHKKQIVAGLNATFGIAFIPVSNRIVKIFLASQVAANVRALRA